MNMTKLLWNFSLLVFGASLALSQTVPYQPATAVLTHPTAVSGYVSDGISLWAGGTVTAMVINNPSHNSQPVTDKSGVPLVTLFGPYIIGGDGFYQFNVQDMLQLVPPNSTMRFTFCPLSTGPCSIYNTPINQPTGSMYFMGNPVSGINVAYFSALVVPYGYGGYQVKPLPTPGQIYYNVTTSTEGYWNGSAWIPFGGGVGTVYSVALSVPTEWAVSGSPCTSNCTLSFAWANPVSIAHGGTNAITAPLAMVNLLPAYVSGDCLTNDGAGNLSWTTCVKTLPTIYYQTFEENGSALTQRATANFSSRFNCTDSSSPARTNCDLAASGVTPGTYFQTTADTYGRTTAGSNGAYVTTTCNTNSGGYGCYNIAFDGTIHETFTTTALNNDTPTQITLPFPYPTRMIGIICSDNGPRVFSGNTQPVGAAPPNSSGECSGTASQTTPQATVCLLTPATGVGAYCTMDAN